MMFLAGSRGCPKFTLTVRNAIRTQTLTLLGKLGGRNRRWLKAPQELPYKEHTEHGMRLILTLLPATSFLVPLDKCLQFSLDAVAGKGKGAPAPAWQQSM